jgi:hypothetical protein
VVNGRKSREAIISFFNHVPPTIAAWMNPVGREFKKIVGWADHVLDVIRVTISHSIMTFFHSRFVQLFKQFDFVKVTVQRLDRLRTEFSYGVEARIPK